MYKLKHPGHSVQKFRLKNLNIRSIKDNLAELERVQQVQCSSPLDARSN